MHARPTPHKDSLTNRLIHNLTRGAVAVAATGGLMAGLAGVASAAPGPAHTPQVQTGHGMVEHHENLGSAHGSQHGNLRSTMGFNLYNYGADTLQFVKTDGQLPAPDTSPMTTGAQRNFELPAPIFSTASGSTYYNVDAPNGTQVGSFKITFWSGGQWSISQSMTGNNKLDFVQGSDDPDDIYVEDAVGSDNASQLQTMAPGSSAEQSFLQQTTQQGIGSSNFTDVTQTTQWSKPTLIAQAYNGQSVADELTTGKSYNFSTTDTWGVNVTAGFELKAFNASVEGTYSHGVTTGTEEDTSYQATVQPGYTSYIWGQVWQYVDDGTMVVKVGNTTWSLPGVIVYNAVPNTALTYSSTEASGQHLLPAGTIGNLTNNGDVLANELLTKKT